MIAAAGGEQHRREEAASCAKQGQRAGILQQGQGRGGGHQTKQQGKGQRRGQQMIQLEGGEDSQIHDADAAALRQQGETGPRLPLEPAKAEQSQSAQGHAEQAQFNGNHVAVSSVFEQEGHAEEEHQQADAEHHIAFGEKGFQLGGGALIPSRFGRQARQRRFDLAARRLWRRFKLRLGKDLCRSFLALLAARRNSSRGRCWLLNRLVRLFRHLLDQLFNMPQPPFQAGNLRALAEIPHQQPAEEHSGQPASRMSEQARPKNDAADDDANNSRYIHKAPFAVSRSVPLAHMNQYFLLICKELTGRC